MVVSGGFGMGGRWWCRVGVVQGVDGGVSLTFTLCLHPVKCKCFFKLMQMFIDVFMFLQLK